MTLDKFNYIVSHAYQMGQIVKTETTQPPFCLEEVTNEMVDFEGYRVCYQDKHFLWMEEIRTGLPIKEQDCTAFDVQSMNDNELTQLVKDAQKVLRQREIEQANIAINEFNKAWQKLKAFGEVRLRVSATGEKHFHTTVNKMTIDILPLT